MLQFGRANAKLIPLEKKLKGKLYTFSMLAGISCPNAKECKSQVVEINGSRRVKDGPNTLFRCFSASQEVLFTSVYNSRRNNRQAILACQNNKDKLVALIDQSLPTDATIIRIHVSGDFITQNYFDAWLEVCSRHPNIHFYSYTKSLPFWIKRISQIPSNLVLTASKGGTRDDLITKHNLRSAIVVPSEYRAKRLGLRVDHDDSLAIKSGKDFALVIHGPQPKGSLMSKAWQRLKTVGKGGYSRV